MENPYPPGSVGPDGWPIVPKVAPPPGHGREGDFKIPYHLVPLDSARKEIRLVHITQRRPHPDQPEYYQLRVGLSVVSLLDEPRPVYKALSYVWNEQMPMPDAQGIDNFLQSQQRVLKMALKKLSEDGEELILWVDALCVNQEDDEEKTSQVAMMSDIYQGAEEVIAWLGLESKTITKAFDLVEAWAAFAQRHQEQPWLANIQSIKGKERSQLQKVFTLEELVRQAREEVPQGFDEMKSGSFSESLIALGIMTYWSRAWIFQELVFASKCRIQNGTHHTSLTTIMAAMKAWNAITEATKKIEPSVWDASKAKWHFTNLGRDTGIYGSTFGDLRMYTMLAALSRARTPGQPVSSKGILTLDMLREFSGFDATDPRDKIFALWGFVDPESPYANLLMPNYSLSVQEVFARATQYIIFTQKSLDILEYHSHGENIMSEGLRATGFYVAKKELLKLPSWVPDWRFKIVKDYREDVFTTAVDNSFLHETDFLTDEFMVHDPANDTLGLKLLGRETGKVKEVFTEDVFPYPVAPGEPQLNHVRNLRNFVHRIASHGQDILCQYLRHVYGSMQPDLLSEIESEPLDIFAEMAHSDPAEIAGRGVLNGKPGILLLLISVLDPLVKMIYAQSAGMRDWLGADLADVPPTVVALMKLFTEEQKNSNGRNTIIASFFGNRFAPMILDSNNASLNNIVRSHQIDRQRFDRWTDVASEPNTGTSDVSDPAEEDGDIELLERAIQLSLEPDGTYVSMPSANKANGLDTGSTWERMGLVPDETLNSTTAHVDNMSDELSCKRSSSSLQSAVDSRDTSDDEGEELAQAIRLSLKEDDGSSCTLNGVSDDPVPELAMDEEDDEDLARAIQLSLEQVDQGSVDDLQDLHWLAELIQALSAPGDSQVSNLGTAIQAILNVKEAESIDYARQLHERPDQPVWKAMWYQGRCPDFFITEDRRLAAHSSCLSVKAGDVTVKFGANNTSFVLRPVENGKFQFIGKCIMLNQGLADDFKERTCFEMI